MVDAAGDTYDGTSTVLIPINAAAPEKLPVALVELLGLLRVVVVGYYPVPAQASPEQLRADHEAEAAAVVDEAAAQFADRTEVDSVVVFTHDRAETVDHIAIEYDADAVLTPGDCDETLTRVLVPVRGDENLDGIVSFVADLMRESDAEATLYNVADDDEAAHGELLLRGVCDRLEEEGVDRDRIEWRVDRSGSPSDLIVAAAADHDMLVVGESEPSLRERIFGATTGQVVNRVDRPVLVVRDA